MIEKDKIKLLAFDADDTLWDCQSHFDAVEKEYQSILSDYGTATEISSRLFETETANMPLLGYGCKAFVLSLIENAISISNGELSANKIGQILNCGKKLLNMPATPLQGVCCVLDTLNNVQRKYKMVVFTKGELLDQENKLRRSGLQSFFDATIIVSDKTSDEYEYLCKRFNCSVNELVMVGNSFRSDIAPVLELGGNAIYVPSKTLWQHEYIDEYDHPNLVTVSEISDILQYL